MTHPWLILMLVSKIFPRFPFEMTFEVNKRLWNMDNGLTVREAISKKIVKDKMEKFTLNLTLMDPSEMQQSPFYWSNWLA